MSDEPIVPDKDDAPGGEPDLRAAVAQFNSGDEAGAFEAFQLLAERNSASAMTWLGYIYLNGTGASVDRQAAYHWFSKAAELGDAEAMTFIGSMHYFGSAGTIDMDEARRWYERAAEAGDSDGQFNLAAMLFAAGKHAEAERWNQASAKQGNASAIQNIDARRAYEMVNQKRYAEALLILNRIASEGSAWAHRYLGYMHCLGLGVAKDINQSLSHYEAAYAGGQFDDVAYIIAGLHLRAGRPHDALEWWRKDTKWPISSAYWQYRVLREHPHLASYSDERDELLKRAAASGHIIAKRDIAFRMMRGDAALGGRSQGMMAWLRLFPAIFRIANESNVDFNDERLR